MPDDISEPLIPVSRDALVDTIDYALRHKVRLPMVGPRKARWTSDSESRIAAKGIVKQLELCGVKLAKAPQHERDPTSAIPWNDVRARLWSRVK